MNVMVVDDDDLVRAAIAEILLDAGFEVTAFADPDQALGPYDAVGPPDVLITDINLGSSLNGFDVAAVAHSRWPSIAVILISGLPVHFAGRMLDPRDRYLQKPVSNCNLLKTIQQMSGGE